jgi:purine-binding chemotaxis protein CheW
MTTLEHQNNSEKMKQISTFFVHGHLYGLDVFNVQEVTKFIPMTKVPLSPAYVEGLLNLRGQIATAISLRDLFGHPKNDEKDDLMNVICKDDQLLISLLVDQIGDVIEVNCDDYRPTPDTIPENISRFMEGVYKMPDSLICILNFKQMVKILLEL